jgi:hypothetical protein
MGIKTTQNFTLILKLLRKMRKKWWQKVIGKKGVQKSECTFFLSISTDLKSALNSAYF